MAEEPKYAEFGKALARLFEGSPKKQIDVAVEIGVSTGYVSRWVGGNRRPGTMDLLRKLAIALNGDIDELARLTGYSTEADVDNRPELPGWELLTRGDQAAIRRTVAQMADARRSATRAARPSRPPTTLPVKAPEAQRSPRARPNQAGPAA